MIEFLKGFLGRRLPKDHRNYFGPQKRTMNQIVQLCCKFRRWEGSLEEFKERHSVSEADWRQMVHIGRQLKEKWPEK